MDQKCTSCKKTQPLSEFVGHRIKTCKKCKECRERLRITDNALRFKKMKNSNDKLEAAKRSSKHDWYLSDEFAKELFTQPCHYCGFLDLEIRCNGIDRMDNTKCYVPSNCVPCCKHCNFAKHTLDYNSFIDLCHKVSDNFRENSTKCTEQISRAEQYSLDQRVVYM